MSYFISMLVSENKTAVIWDPLSLRCRWLVTPGWWSVSLRPPRLPGRGENGALLRVSGLLNPFPRSLTTTKWGKWNLLPYFADGKAEAWRGLNEVQLTDSDSDPSSLTPKARQL